MWSLLESGGQRVQLSRYRLTVYSALMDGGRLLFKKHF